MAVNSLQPALPYTVTASNETADHSKSRDEKKENQNKNKLGPQGAPKLEVISPKTEDEKPTEKEAIELTGQIIDSSKVIELLSHRPKYQRSPRNCFKDKRNSKEKSQLSDVKTINKSF